MVMSILQFYILYSLKASAHPSAFLDGMTALFYPTGNKIIPDIGLSLIFHMTSSILSIFLFNVSQILLSFSIPLPYHEFRFLFFEHFYTNIRPLCQFYKQPMTVTLNILPIRSIHTHYSTLLI